MIEGRKGCLREAYCEERLVMSESADVCVCGAPNFRADNAVEESSRALAHAGLALV